MFDGHILERQMEAQGVIYAGRTLGSGGARFGTFAV